MTDIPAGMVPKEARPVLENDRSLKAQPLRVLGRRQPTPTADAGKPMGGDAEGRMREVLAARLPGPTWANLRENIRSGSVEVLSDPESWIAAAALAAMRQYAADEVARERAENERLSSIVTYLTGVPTPIGTINDYRADEVDGVVTTLRSHGYDAEAEIVGKMRVAFRAVCNERDDARAAAIRAGEAG